MAGGLGFRVLNKLAAPFARAEGTLGYAVFFIAIAGAQSSNLR